MNKPPHLIRSSRLITLVALPLAAIVFAQEPALAGSSSYSPVVSFATLPVLQATTPIPGSLHVPGDFNGDGISDILWFNSPQSQVGYWTMSAAGSSVTQTGAHTFSVIPGYFVGAIGDFNNDGSADLVFTSANRDLVLWTNDRSGGFTPQAMGTYPSNWQLIGAGDVDGDGYDDLLWLDPSDCQFAYWTMHGAVRTGYKIIPVTCGYYPVGIGYYSPANRISILWTSSAHDLWVWDSARTGFKSYQLFSSGEMTYVWAIGGGYMGNGIGVEYANQGQGTTSLGTARGDFYSRTFDAYGNQTGFTRTNIWGGGNVGQTEFASGGYIIQSNGVNTTGLYALYAPSNELLTSGPLGSDSIRSGPAPMPQGFTQNWVYPMNWWIVGAASIQTSAPPWQ